MNTTAPKQLILSQAQATQLRAAAAAAYPAECCGLLAGKGDDIVEVTEVVAVPNVAADRQRRFDIDPQAQFDLLHRLRGSGQRMVGHYHSHPNGRGELSSHDRAMANDPDAIWVVIAMDAQGCALPPTAFMCPQDGPPVRIEMVIRG